MSLSKQGIRSLVSRDYISGYISSVFLKLNADQVVVFYWIKGLCQFNLS